jgi:hypothetical protein
VENQVVGLRRYENWRLESNDLFTKARVADLDLAVADRYYRVDLIEPREAQEQTKLIVPVLVIRADKRVYCAPDPTDSDLKVGKVRELRRASASGIHSKSRRLPGASKGNTLVPESFD